MSWFKQFAGGYPQLKYQNAKLRKHIPHFLLIKAGAIRDEHEIV